MGILQVMERPEEVLLSRLQGWIPNFTDTLLAPDGRWNARGIIDERKQLYPLSGDTKLISKVIEVMLESDLQISLNILGTVWSQLSIKTIIPM